MSRIQQVADATPSWANWAIILGTWAVSILQPFALFITVAWGSLQIYLAIERRWFRKGKD
jgi:hypothetical protein